MCFSSFLCSRDVQKNNFQLCCFSDFFFKSIINFVLVSSVGVGVEVGVGLNSDAVQEHFLLWTFSQKEHLTNKVHNTRLGVRWWQSLPLARI